MRYLLCLALFCSSHALAGWFTYTDTRDLSLDASDVERLEIRNGHGFIRVEGVSGISRIQVLAEIRIPASNRGKASAIESDFLDLSLEGLDGTAILVGDFRDYPVWRGEGASVRLTVQVPKDLDVAIEDGTGYIDVANLAGSLTIDDGPGAIELSRIGGKLTIRDGAGWIDVDRIDADVHIEDRSGAISVSRAGGNVVIDDGSGRVDVRDVSGDLTLVDNASGRFTFSGVRGVIRDESRPACRNRSVTCLR